MRNFHAAEKMATNLGEHLYPVAPSPCLTLVAY